MQDRQNASQKAMSKLKEGNVIHKATHQKSAFILDKTNLSRKLMRLQSPTFDEIMPFLKEIENYANPEGTDRMEMKEEFVRYALDSSKQIV